ncbi:MAG: sulfatase [Acidobacteria bacterium]|nr:sulfatase [Acidobacteriota bacterium]
MRLHTRRPLSTGILILALVGFIFTIIIIFRGIGNIHSNFDFINHFQSSHKTGFNIKTTDPSLFPPSDQVIPFDYIKVMIKKVFSGDTDMLNRNGNPEKKKDVKIASGCFRTVFKNKAENFNFRYIFKRQNANNYFEILISKTKIYKAEIARISEGNREIIDTIELPDEISPEKLNITFFKDILYISTDDEPIFQCSHPELDISGGVEFKPLSIAPGMLFSVKFAEIPAKITDSLNEEINKVIPQRRPHKLNLTKLPWNLLASEDHLTGEYAENPFLRRVKREDITFPSIYFMPESSLEYKLKAPENPVLSFILAPYLPDKLKTDTKLIFDVAVSDEDDKEIIRLRYNLAEITESESEYKIIDQPLNIKSGEDIKVRFSFPAEMPTDKALFREVPVAALGAPVLKAGKLPGERNILLISLDTLRPDHLGIYGYERDTSPNIDIFARKSILFKNATAQSNWTLPSHMSFFASLFPMETGYGWRKDLHQSVRFAQEVKLLPEYMKENGYTTGAITGGGYVSGFFGFNRGMDYFKIIEENCEDTVTESIEWIKRNRDTKFFFFLHTYEIHKPYTHDYFLEKEGKPNQTVKDKTIARYDSGIRYTDEQIGRLFDYLEKTGLYDQTLIVITSDHGENFEILDREKVYGDHGKTLYNREIQVPLIIGGALDKTGGKVIESQVSLVDLMPTILDYAEIDIPSGIRGVSLRDINHGDNMDRRTAYSEAVFNINEKKSLRNTRYKVIKNYRFNKDKVSTNLEFYDLSTDRQERQNLISSKSGIKDTLFDRLEKIIKAVSIKYKKLSSYKSHSGAIDRRTEKQLRALGYLGN